MKKWLELDEYLKTFYGKDVIDYESKTLNLSGNFRENPCLNELVETIKQANLRMHINNDLVLKNTTNYDFMGVYFKSARYLANFVFNEDNYIEKMYLLVDENLEDYTIYGMISYVIDKTDKLFEPTNLFSLTMMYLSEKANVKDIWVVSEKLKKIIDSHIKEINGFITLNVVAFDKNPNAHKSLSKRIRDWVLKTYPNKFELSRRGVEETYLCR